MKRLIWNELTNELYLIDEGAQDAPVLTLHLSETGTTWFKDGLTTETFGPLLVGDKIVDEWEE